MSINLVVIGSSKYEDELIPPISGVLTDIYRIRDYFRLWGVCQDSITFLSDAEATKAQILRSIRVSLLKRTSANDSTIIYYAGHGRHTKENVVNDKYTLLCYDSMLADLIGTGITIEELIESAYRSDPKKLFLFIDACEVGISGVSEQLIKEIGTSDDKSLCIVTATRGYSAIDTPYGGVFTSALLKSIAFLRNNPTPYCSALIASIESTAREYKIPLPQSIHVGSENAWLLDGSQMEYECLINFKKYVKRSDSLISITDVILRNPTIRCFSIYGAAKTGKTLIALQLSMSFTNCVYCSIEPYPDIAKIKSDISRASAIKLMQTGRMPAFGCEISFDILLNYIAAEKISLSIILDHAERISGDKFEALYDELTSIGFVKVIAFSRVKVQLLEREIVSIPCPSFSFIEYDQFLKLYCSQELYHVYRGRYDLFNSKPQELLHNLNCDKSTYESKKACVDCVCKTGGFVDDKLFATVFQLPLTNIAELIDTGLILMSDDCFVPHETLYEEYSIEKNAFYSSTEAELYWEEQTNATPANTFVCHQMQKLIDRKGIAWLRYPERVLRILVSSNISQCNWSGLENLFPYLVQFRIPDALLEAGASLAHVARGMVFEDDRRIRQVFSFVDTAKWNLICSEIDYWKGNFSHSIATSLCVLNEKRFIIDKKTRQSAYLNIATANFFLGNWAEAKQYLNNITECTGRLFGWKNLILGTILAIRGENFDSGTKMLNDSIEVLTSVKDFAGVGIAYGNIGECYVKKGEYSEARRYLRNGKKYALLTHDDATCLEITRNELLASIYSKCVYDIEAEEREKEIVELLTVVSDKTELMQVYNTLAISAAYHYQIDRAKNYLNNAVEITSGNLEYDIYTSLSKAVIHYVEQNTNEFECSIKKVYSLSIAGNNRFAIRQAIKTITDISLIYQLELPRTNTYKEMERKLMETSITILSENARIDVGYVEFINSIRTDNSIVVCPADQETRGVGEFIVKILNSVGLKKLMEKLRDAFGSNTVELKYEDATGKKIEFRATGKDVDVTTIVGYISGNLKKESQEEIDIKKIDYPIELKLGIEKKSK